MKMKLLEYHEGDVQLTKIHYVNTTTSPRTTTTTTVTTIITMLKNSKVKFERNIERGKLKEITKDFCFQVIKRAYQQYLWNSLV